MKILHYFLGFPPYRTGGLTKYAFDLMKAQMKDGNSVIALWPGQIRFWAPNICIKKRCDVYNISNYELVNPLPVSLDEGITNFIAYTKPCVSSVYMDYFIVVQPDVIHIHTLMGLHREFIDVANRLKIRTVFTSHDYFGLCPKVTLYRFGVPCDNDHGCKDCIQCNVSALSIKKIRIMQSVLYRLIKNSTVVKQLRKRHRINFFLNEDIPDMPVSKDDIPILAENYKKLREYYIGMLSNIDLIHFNSTLTESIYCKYLSPKSSKVMTITHQDIADNRNTNFWKIEYKLRITYLAPVKPFKGFVVLKNTLDDIWNSGVHDFELMLFSYVQNQSPYMKVHKDGFQYEQLGSILADTDVLVAPSVWYETFGFTVLEAISYGVPVIVSSNVGARDIVGNGGIIVEAGSEESLKKAITSLTYEKLKELRNNIQEATCIKTWQQFVDENYVLYEMQFIK